MARRDPFLDAFGGTDRFDIRRRIGGGGMGVVYEALDRQRQERVALKTMREPTPERLLRFKNEFRALAELRHPNLVRLYELIADGGWWFFTMELIDGESFLTYVEAELNPFVSEPGLRVASDADTLDPGQVSSSTRVPARFDEERLRHAFGQLAEGLAALHRAGQIHRDVKPANVLVSHEGRVVIVDFGLVKDAPVDGPRTISGVSGTLAYMAPEQAAGLPVTTACDWYAAGVVLFQALTGRLPFAHPTLGGVPREPPRPSTVASGVPPDLDELCVELLSHEPELRPRGREILVRLQSSDGAPAETTRLPAFVGRTRELEQLKAAYHSVAVASAPRIVIVDGESGVGKSALGEQLVSWLRGLEERPVVLQGRCAEAESVPFQTMDGIVDGLSRLLGRLPETEAAALWPHHATLLAQTFPVLRRRETLTRALQNDVPDQGERRVRVFAAAKELLARVAARWRIVLFIDNLQWADDDGLAMLTEILHPPDAPTLLFVGFLRSSADRLTAADLAARLPGEVERLTLGGLDAADAERLAKRLLGRERDVAPFVAEAGGHPQFIAELCRHARPSRELSLEEIFRQEIDRFAPDARTLLELIALASGPTSLAVIAFAAALKPELAMTHVRQLGEARLMNALGSGLGARLEPYHGRVRETVLARLDGPRRALLHERLARALEAAGRADPEELARHWRGAGQRERAAALFATAAAEAAKALAFARAARLYRQSLEDEPGGATALARWTALGDALHDCGQGVAAAEAWQRAAEHTRDLDAVALRRRAAEQLLRGGHVDEGMQLFGRVLADVGLRWPRRTQALRAALMWQRARIRLSGPGVHTRDVAGISPLELARADVCNSAAAGLAVIDPLLGAYFQARALRVAVAAGEPERLCRALTSEAVSCAALGARQRARTAALLDRADALAEPLPSPLGRALTRMGRGVATFLLGDWQASAAASQRAIELYRENCKGAGWELGNAVLFSILARIHLGELGQLQRELPLAVAEAQQRGDLHALIALGTGQPILVWLSSDDAAGAQASLDALDQHRPQPTWAMQEVYFNTWARASLDLYRGEPAPAHAHIVEHWPALEQSSLLRLELIRLVMKDLRARATLALAAQRDAPELLAQAERDARQLAGARAGWAVPLGHLVRAGVCRVRGDDVGAIRLLDDCIRDFDAQHMALHAAAARRARGELGDRDALAAADAWSRAQKIRDPRRLARLFAPALIA
jgi:hypothetical protein